MTSEPPVVRAKACFHRVAFKIPCKTILDIGSGPGIHAEMFREAGKAVTTTDLRWPCDIPGDFMADSWRCAKDFDLIWCSHVLEHQLNVNAFLKKIFWLFNPGGYLAITVPPMKPQIVGGHVTLWNAGLLLYNLILAGFDCSKASVLTDGYDISVIVRREERIVLPELAMDKGDIELLAPFFPVPVFQGFDGNIASVNWR